MKLISRISALLAAAVLGTISVPAQSLGENWEPKADPAATVTYQNARFTVLTSRLIRMEWSEDGQFEDRASLAIVNRKLDVPSFKVSTGKKKLVIKTDDLTLTYLGGGKFTEKNLSVAFTMPAPGARKPLAVTWKPGADESGNLLGTTRTLDGCMGREKINRNDPWEQGILSRDGWVIVDESSRQLFESTDSDWKNWVAERPLGDRQDLYIFAYGHDYKAALSDFTKVAGKIPLPPKYMLGYWWSRYWQYSDFEFVNLAEEIRSHNIPLDVMVIDMDWHETFSLRRKDAPRDEFGQRIGWTGYTWQKQLFPDPQQFLADIHDMGLKTSLNLHPASGVQPYEDCYDRFVKDYLSRTSDYDGPEGYVYGEGGWQFAGPDPKVGQAGEKAPVPFRICQEDWADAYFNSVIHPIEQQGVDFWWLDWQQWKQSKYTKDLSNTFWLNYTFFNDKVRQSVSEGSHAKRPVIYHRWGGLGSHRYQIGFSGDTYEEWSVLKFLPEFTCTASNVGYGYWGHDIGGHMQQSNHNSDPEMYTRWLQYGVFTPIFKTHCTKNRWIERRIWMYPEHFSYMREAIRLRYTLSPYVYDLARAGYDTGISMCRPLYYDCPEAAEAYEYKEEYLFGDNILATVVCEPADPQTGLAKRNMWFPAGSDWYDMATGKTYKGGTKAELSYTIAENPWFVKCGSVIPLASETIGSLQEQNSELRILVAPGAGHTTYTHYEDDGATQAYASEFATTRIDRNTNANTTVVKVYGREGSFEGMAASRKLSFIFECTLAPESVKVNGQEVSYERHPSQKADKACWSYNGADLSTTVYLPEENASESVCVEVTFPQTNGRILDGKKGLIRRMMAITPETKISFADNIDSYMMLPDAFLKVAQAGSIITEDPKNAVSHLVNIDVDEMNEVLRSYGKLPESYLGKVKALSDL